MPYVDLRRRQKRARIPAATLDRIAGRDNWEVGLGHHGVLPYGVKCHGPLETRSLGEALARKKPGDAP